MAHSRQIRIRKGKTVLLTLLLITIGLVWVALNALAQSRASDWRPKETEWTSYTADIKGTRYKPFDQVNGSNLYKLEGTPIMVNGVVYTTGGTRRSVIALDAKTGELLWAHSIREGKRAANSPRQLSGRGVSFWSDGHGDDRVIYVTTGYRLVELNANTGAEINSFGASGIVDLKVGVVKGVDQQIDLETGEIGIHSTPAVARDVVIIGSSMREGATVPTHNNTKGLVRAFDV